MSEGNGLEPVKPLPVEILRRAWRRGVRPSLADLDAQVQDLLAMVGDHEPWLAGALAAVLSARDSALLRETDRRRHGRSRPVQDIDAAVRDAARALGTWAVHPVEAHVRRRGIKTGTARLAAAVRRLRPPKK